VVGSGDLIRDHIARGTPFGKKVEAAIAAGNFAPDSDILYWMGLRLKEPDAAPGYVLDGFPRDLAQGQAFDRTLGADADAVRAIELIVPETVLVERLAGREVCPVCGGVYNSVHRPPRVRERCDVDGAALERRPDDCEEAVRRRMAIYQDVTAPVAEYYRQSRRLVAVDGDGEEEAVFGRLIQAIEADRS
jgi:adenylate kinase